MAVKLLAKVAPKLLKVIPTIIDFLPAIISILAAIKCKWYWKIFVFLLLVSVCCILCGVAFFPEAVDIVHPIDSIGRMGEEAITIFNKLGK